MIAMNFIKAEDKSQVEKLKKLASEVTTAVCGVVDIPNASSIQETPTHAVYSISIVDLDVKCLSKLEKYFVYDKEVVDNYILSIER